MTHRQLAPLLTVGAAAVLGFVVLAQGPLAGSPPSPTPAASLATSRPPSPGVTVTPTPNVLRPIPEGFRVRIARLGIDLPIAEGIIQRDVEQQQTPEGWAFHLPGTAIPGQIGNTYIYSHARTGMFLSLWDARVGDEVTITTPEGNKIVYLVSEVRPRVAPTDISVAQPSSDQRLTLQTSTGPSPSDPRFVVIALPRS